MILGRSEPTECAADLLQYLLPHVPSSLLMAVNDNKSPPLHWAILNNQVECTKLLAQLPEEQGGGLPMLEVSPRSISTDREHLADKSP
jgi:ankyrin repeat protein